MSNTSTNYAELNVTNDDMKEMLAEGSGSATSAAPAKKTKNAGYRILALILALAPIICLIFVKIGIVISTTAGYAIYDATFFDALKALFKADGIQQFYGSAAETITNAVTTGFDGFKFLGLPTISGAGAVGKVMGLVLYLIPAAIVLTVIFAIIALFSGKAAPAMCRAIAFVNFGVYGVYALCVLAVSLYYANIKTTVDLFTVILAAACFVIYLVLAFLKAGKHTWMTLLLTILTAAFAGCVVYGIVTAADSIAQLLAVTDKSFISSLTKGEFYRYAIIALLGIALFGFAVSAMRMSTKKGYGFDIFRYIVHFLIAVAFVVFSCIETNLQGIQLYICIAAAIALVEIILCIIAVSVLKSKKKAAAKETEPAVAEQTATEETVTETSGVAAPATQASAAPAKEEEDEEETGVYAEAVRYEGPVAEEAPEAQPLSAPAAAEATAQPVYNFTQPEAQQPAGPAATADYDFYNSRSFDPFIASLSSAEREQFTEIFILKYKGDTKNLPDYQVGGDNTEFFRKVFIYLGQYRDRIPDSLLGKMYQFAIRK